MTDHAEIAVRRWLAEFVVGLNLCPYARPLMGAANLRIVICGVSDETVLRRAFLRELDLLQCSIERDIATTLLAFSEALQDFQEYLRFLAGAQELLVESGLEGVVQLASFHPHYRFAGETPGAASHYSNRSPYPIIHLLREDMLTRAVQEAGDPYRIPDRNIQTLTGIGAEELERRWQALFLP
ncbi:MAG: DUF1415 domain-containing protein [Halioglobus sp.]